MNIDLTDSEAEKVKSIALEKGGMEAVQWLKEKGKIPAGCSGCQISKVIVWILSEIIDLEEK